jgi:hypothetical protein
MKCGYRNCNIEIIELNNKKYCSTSCRICEKKYRNRRKKNNNPKIGRPKNQK